MEIPAPGMMPEMQGLHEPSLLDEFGHHEFTMFGVTATGHDLDAMCPIPREERSVEGQNRFMATMMTAAGIEIPERYAELRAEFQSDDWLAQRRAAKQQEETAREAEAVKQTEQVVRQQKEQEKAADDRRDREVQAAEPTAVVEQSKPATVEVESLAPLPVIVDSMRDTVIEKPAEMSSGNDGAAIGVIAPLEPLPPVRSAETEQAIRVSDLYVEAAPVLAQPELATAAPLAQAEMPQMLTPITQERVIMNSILTGNEDAEISAEAADAASAEFITGEEVLLPDPSLATEDRLRAESPFEFVESELVFVGAEADAEANAAAPSFAAELFDEERKRSAALTDAEVEVDPEAIARQRFVDHHEWTLEVANTEPEQVFEDFTESLFELVALNETAAEPAAQSEIMTDEADTDMLALVPTRAEEQVEPVPPVCKEVAERLVALEPSQKEVALPIVKSLAEAVQEVRLVEASKVGPEEVAVATERLRELVIELFDAIGIEYDDEKVEQFLQTLLRPEFMPAPSQAEELDLEHMGTHEVKRHFPLATTLADFFASHPLQQVLGTFALFRTNPGLQGEILAADTWSDGVPTRWYNKANA